jgi:hypothetical protein
MHGGQGVAHLLHPLHATSSRYRVSGGNDLSDASAGDERAREEQTTVIIADVEDGGEPRLTKRRVRTKRPGDSMADVRRHRREHPDGHFAFECRIEGEIQIPT